MEKKYTFTSLLFFGFLLFFSGCNSKKTTSSPFSSDQLDSLNEHYEFCLNNLDALGNAEEAIDVFIAKCDSLRIDSLLFRGYMLKTRLLGRHKKYERAIEATFELLERAKNRGDSGYMGKAYNKLGIYHSRTHDYLAAFNFYNTSFKIHRNIGDSSFASKRLFSMADTQRILGDYVGSNVTAVDGLRYSPKGTAVKIRSVLYHTIAVSYREIKNYNEALFWNQKSLSFIKDTNFIKEVGAKNAITFKNTKANILADLREYEEAIVILKTLLNDPVVVKDSLEYARILSNLGKIKWLYNSGNTETEGMLLEALAIRQKKKSPVGLVASNIHLSKYYTDLDAVQAIHYAQEARKESKRLRNPLSALEALDIITTIDSTALEAYKEYKRLNESLEISKKSMRQIYAPTRFENESLAKENLEKEKQVEKAKSEKKWLLLFFVLALIAGSIYIVQRNRLQKSKQIAEKILASYEAEGRMSKEVHDSIANNIYLIKLLLAESNDKEKIMSKLKHVYDKARNISRDSSDIDFESYENELSELITNYNTESTHVFIKGERDIQWKDYHKVTKIVIYRLLQELMTNMQKHSESNLVSVVFRSKEKGIEIVYTDNGLGLPKSGVHNRNGIKIMENRIKAIGGNLSFDLTRENGLKAIITV
ncbi:hypothetical protein POV27_03530 [Aureisphaera galaxeae]|uniref:tetratricopeptide repeat-containing sensor histidine kinase n=1 Tax=Aureisphaera galaxeae TaxID=1538023 RepID=UPI00235059EC|nr:hypothetical protein [Aureisphaera galaxeae]MDC8003105.1 hypothetical protein [Aureisphaera galaxeae]